MKVLITGWKKSRNRKPESLHISLLRDRQQLSNDENDDNNFVVLITFRVVGLYRFMDSTMHDLFTKMQTPNHSFFRLLSPRRPLHQSSRGIGHGFELPSYNYKLHNQLFVTNCLLSIPNSTPISDNQYPLFAYFDFIQFHCVLIGV